MQRVEGPEPRWLGDKPRPPGSRRCKRRRRVRRRGRACEERRKERDAIHDRTNYLLHRGNRGDETPGEPPGTDTGVGQQDYFDEVEDKVVQLTAARASLPAKMGAGGQVNISSLLPDWMMRELEYGVRMVGPVEPPIKPCLLVAEGEYGPLCERLEGVGVVEFLPEKPVGHVMNGLFGVVKSELVDRTIMDARPANQHSRDACRAALPNLEAIAKLGVGPGEQLAAACSDLDNFYHRLVVPPAWRALFGLPPILRGGKLVWPVWRTLPMGWKWSVVLAQEAHVHCLTKGYSLFLASHRRFSPPVPTLLTGEATAASVYIDDLAAFSADGPDGCAANDLVTALKPHAPTVVKDEKTVLADATRPTPVLGAEIGGRDGLVAPKADKLKEFVTRTEALLAAKWVQPKSLMSVNGGWVWRVLLTRGLLSIMDPVFRQARSQRKWVRVWPSCRRVYRILMAVVPLLVVQPARRPGGVVATDSSDYGGGVVVYEDAPDDTYWAFAPLAYYKGRADLATPEYREALRATLEPCKATASFCWLWKDPGEHIGVKEGRAMHTGLRRLMVRRAGSMVDRRYLALVDNQGVVAAFAKGRSRNPVVNGLISSYASFSLLSGSTCDVVWVHTDLQPADGPSRVGQD
jgi:hypothetical protein